MTLRRPKQLLSGVLFLFIGIVCFLMMRDLSVGSARSMGPGYFPLALVFILFGLSLVLIVQSFMGESRDEEPSEAIATSRYGGLRAAAAILSAAVIFGLLIRPAGLAPSVFLGVIIGSLGMPNYSWRTALLLALALAFLCCLVFSVLLGLRIPIFGPVFGF